MFYETLKQVCAKNNTNPTALAKKLGISTGNTGRWEKGKVPGGDILIRMAEELGVTTDCLLGREPPATPEGGRPEMTEHQLLVKQVAERAEGKGVDALKAIIAMMDQIDNQSP